MMALNLNETIKVKLTDLGKEIYYHQHDQLDEYLRGRGFKGLERHFPAVDKDGYTSFQLWSFIELYGPHMGMEKPNVIEPLNIYIDEGDLLKVEN